MTNAIFLAFDDAFTNYGLACIRSICLNYPSHPEIVLLYTGVDKRVFELVERVARISILDSSKYAAFMQTLDDYPAGPTGSHIVFCKYLVWSSYFDRWNKVLYLDSDTLVMRPLDKLFSNYGFYITPNHMPSSDSRVFRTGCREDRKLHETLSRFGLVYPDDMNDMANAGVFMVSREWRTQRHLGTLLNLQHSFSEYVAYADQSILSLWCAMMGIEFVPDYTFNYQVAFRHQSELRFSWRDAHIIHFAGVKPEDVRLRCGRDNVSDLVVEYARYLED